MKRLALLLMLAATAGGVTGCGAAPKTTSTASETTTQATSAAMATGACLGWEETSITWAKEMVHVAEVAGTDSAYTALARADEESYLVEAAAKKVAAALPSTGEAVTRYVTSLGMIRTAAGENRVSAMAENGANQHEIIAACHANTTGG